MDYFAGSMDAVRAATLLLPTTARQDLPRTIVAASREFYCQQRAPLEKRGGRLFCSREKAALNSALLDLVDEHADYFGSLQDEWYVPCTFWPRYDDLSVDDSSTMWTLEGDTELLFDTEVEAGYFAMAFAAMQRALADVASACDSVPGNSLAIAYLRHLACKHLYGLSMT